MKLIISILLFCLCKYVIGTPSPQQKKLESLKSLVFNISKATVTPNSNDLKQLLNLLRSTLDALGTGRKIGFSVSLKRHSFTYGTRQTVIYDNILTNDGNGYDERTFTCPVAGVYMFVVDALCKQATFLALDHNKTPIAFLHRDSRYSKNPLVQISRTVLLHLTKGDHVKVCCLLSNAAKASISQQTKLESLKSLIFNNAKATVTLDSTDLKQLLKLSKSTSVAVTSPNPGVCFSVYMKALKGKHVTLGHEQTVIYDGILTNEGNGYDDRTGVFACPVAGTYMFVVDSSMGSRSWIHLKLNKTIVASLYRHTPDSQNPWLQISSWTVVLKLKVGDHVKVVTGGNNVLIHKETY